MSHKRQQIREQFATNCTSLTTTGANVFQSRIYPLERSDLPGLCIYTKSEKSEPRETGAPGARNIERNLTLKVEAYASATSNIDDTLDTISKEIETAISNSTGLAALCEDWYLSDTDIDFFGDGEKPIARMKLDFLITYSNIENNPT